MTRSLRSHGRESVVRRAWDARETTDSRPWLRFTETIALVRGRRAGALVSRRRGAYIPPHHGPVRHPLVQRRASEDDRDARDPARQGRAALPDVLPAARPQRRLLDVAPAHA